MIMQMAPADEMDQVDIALTDPEAVNTRESLQGTRVALVTGGAQGIGGSGGSGGSGTSGGSDSSGAGSSSATGATLAFTGSPGLLWLLLGGLFLVIGGTLGKRWSTVPTR